SQEVQDRLQEQAYKIVNEVQVIGGTNVQFAHDPVSDRIIVIEINPRTSRSSALASKATGFPIALVSAMLASGLTLKDIECGKYGTLDKYVPDGDYVVIKFARWAFEKFKGVEDKLGTQMRAVGEVMSIGKTYKEAFQKAIRSLEKGRYGLGFASNYNELSLDELLAMLVTPSSDRQFIMYEALRKGATIEQLHELTAIKRYFIEQMAELVEEEEQIRAFAAEHEAEIVPDDMLVQAKKNGFSDRYLANLMNVPEVELREYRESIGCTEAWEGVHVSSTKDSAYYYSTYNAPDESTVSDGRKVMILGGGPNRIGQGIEFDYCCVHAAMALREDGFETIMINCNPETVSTDYDTSDRLYFEPVTLEDVLEICHVEKPEGVIVQYGGQTPLKLCRALEAEGVPIIGTTPDAIDCAEDRERFQKLIAELGLLQPPNRTATTEERALEAAEEIGYPIVVRPSYVLGGRAMDIVHNAAALRLYMKEAIVVSNDSPVLLDRFLNDAVEMDVDAVSDGEVVRIGGLMQHVEAAGVHSGDSACSLPPYSLSPEILAEVKRQTVVMAKALGVVGLMNVQFAVQNAVSDEPRIFVLEVNPRASRTVPFVSKATGQPLAKIAARCMTGRTIAQQGCPVEVKPKYISVKEAVFPFAKFLGVDPVLGPEMRSTGEVMGVGRTFGEALFKSQLGCGMQLPPPGSTVFLSTRDEDKGRAIVVGLKLHEAGYSIVSTRGTARALNGAGVPAHVVNKVSEGRPNIIDKIANKEVQLVITTSNESRGEISDARAIRMASLANRVTYYTTIAGGLAAVEGMKHLKDAQVYALQQMHAEVEA
ncbi:MAG: carbamoyl-phosphate synthase large subunit, partial [Duodenibacillus sp.]|nr:carbamoyl-phosphate synthase large subunit [Duodenibacillus sp.]